MSTVAEWVADPACAGNAMTLLVAGLIYANEGNYVEALKACHTGLNLEMCGPRRPAHAKCLELRPCITSALVQECMVKHRDVPRADPFGAWSFDLASRLRSSRTAWWSSVI